MGRTTITLMKDTADELRLLKIYHDHKTIEEVIKTLLDKQGELNPSDKKEGDASHSKKQFVKDYYLDDNHLIEKEVEEK